MLKRLSSILHWIKTTFFKQVTLPFWALLGVAVGIFVLGWVSGTVDWRINFSWILPVWDWMAGGLTTISEHLSVVVKNNPDFLQTVVGVEGVLIGLALPVSLQVVVTMIKEYDREIGHLFMREPLYQLQFYLLISSLILFLLLMLFENVVIWLLWLSWAVVAINLIIFFFFVRLVHRYATDPDGEILNKIWEYVKSPFKGQ